MTERRRRRRSGSPSRDPAEGGRAPVFLVVEYLVLPQMAGVRRSASLLARVHVGFVVTGALLEAAAISPAGKKIGHIGARQTDLRVNGSRL